MPVELKITFAVGIGIFRGMRTKGENAGDRGFLALGGFGRKGNFQPLAHLDDAGRVGRSQGDGLGGDEAVFVNADALADPHHTQPVRTGGLNLFSQRFHLRGNFGHLVGIGFGRRGRGLRRGRKRLRRRSGA